MALVAPPSSRLPPSVIPPSARGPLQPSSSEPDLSRIRSPALPLPPGAMAPVIISRGQQPLQQAGPRRRISLSRRASDEQGSQSSRAMTSSSSMPPTTNNPTTRVKVGGLLQRFPSLRRSGSRSSSSSSSPSATPAPALSPLPTSPPSNPAGPPPMTTSASLPIARPSLTHPPSPHLPVPPPSAWSGEYVLPLPSPVSPLTISPLSTSPLSVSPPTSPRRSHSSPSTATVANPHMTPSARQEGAEHATPKLSAQKRAQTMPLLPRTHTKRFYGLMEIIETERNYVRDLALLVEVYLPALHALDAGLYPLITRNLPALHTAHVNFLRELEGALRSAGLPLSTEPEDLLALDYSTDEEPGRVARAVARMSRAFFLSTDVWSLYDEYCAQHTLAMNALNKLSTRMGAEWKAFERRCMKLAGSDTASSRVSMDLNSRPPSPTLTGEGDRERGRPPQKQPSLHDLLIGPVQRICRYPLLLAKLLPPELRQHPHLPHGHHGHHEEIGVKELRAAYSVMREIVSRVDEAREQHERELRGQRIAARVEGPQITEHLMLSLGPPLLVGALDVLVLPRTISGPANSPHASSVASSTVVSPINPTANTAAPGMTASGSMTANLPSKVRYLGAFLYAGCLLLVKPKKGNVYEARHWLELANCRMVEPSPDDPPLLNSFCVTKDDKNFYFAASCPQEKAVWLPAISQAIAQEHAVSGSPLSSIAHMPDDDDIVTPVLMQPPVMLPGSHSSSASSSGPTSPISFPPLAGALVLRRPTPQQRQVVDRCLADVYSESCLSARAGAVLFPDSGLAATTGFSRIMHRDSLLSTASGSDRENSPAPTEKKRRRMSARSFTAFSAETFTNEDSALTSVPEDAQDEDAPTITHRRQRTYSYTMNSVRDALHVGRTRPASMQNIPQLQTSTLPSDDQARTTSTSRPGLSRSSSIMSPLAFLAARQRTRSAPVSPSDGPAPPSPVNNRPPPVDTTPISTSTDPSPNSDLNSAIEFSATGRYRDRLESFPGSTEGGSHEGVLSDGGTDQDPSASEESALAPPSPPEVVHTVHVRVPSSEFDPSLLTAKVQTTDLQKLNPQYGKKPAAPTPTPTSSAPSTLRRKNTGSFFSKLNPFTPLTQ